MSQASDALVGIAGLGRMGRALADRLIATGHRVVVWNRSPDKAQALARSGVRVCQRPCDLAAAAGTVLLSLTDGTAVESVAFGEDGLLAGAQTGAAIVDMSTVPPDFSRRLAEAGAQRGIEVLDAPVSGGPGLLRKGQVGIMVGGSDAAYARCCPLLEALGRTIVHAGSSGQGSALKLVNNLVLALAAEATAEALVFARRLGLDPEHVLAITATGGAQMRMMETRGRRMIARDFAPSSSIDDLHKDLTAALALAASCSVATPAAEAVLMTLMRAREEGWGSSDVAALFAAIEAMAR